MSNRPVRANVDGQDRGHLGSHAHPPQKTVILLLGILVIAGIGGISLIGGRNLGPQAVSDKPDLICQPSDCRIEENKRPPDCSCRYSVLVIEFAGKEPELTDVENGVNFDLNSEVAAIKQKISWTRANASDRFLFLDTNGNKRVDNGLELMGSVANQFPSATDPNPNGFLALARYDRADFGGNTNGMIDSGDEVFSRLRVWKDANHNGISEPNELLDFKKVGIEAISLKYETVNRKDRYGNLIRDKAPVHRADRKELWTAYDVVLLPAQ